MIDTPKILVPESQSIAVVRVSVPRAEIQEAMVSARQELTAALAAQGLAPAGPWFSHHLTMQPTTFDLEVGVPVGAPVAPVGRVTAGVRPAVRMARTVYHGPYQGLGAAWGEFDAWLRTAGHTPAADLWESYVAGPETGPDPALWQTELCRPLLATA